MSTQASVDVEVTQLVCQTAELQRNKTKTIPPDICMHPLLDTHTMLFQAKSQNPQAHCLGAGQTQVCQKSSS